MKLVKLIKLLPIVILTNTVTEVIASQTTDTASERWFQIELIIFKNPSLETDNPEVWPAYSPVEHPVSFIKLNGTHQLLTENSEQSRSARTEDGVIPIPSEGLEAFTALLSEERQMNSERRKIKADQRFQLLFHEAWNQPVPDRETVIPIRIEGGETFGRQPELQGYINLYVERYLHLSTDLHLIEYAKSSDPFSLINDQSELKTPTSTTLDTLGGYTLLNTDMALNSQFSRKSDQYFVSVQDSQLKERRRMRSKEIHYLDNPEFGMLVLITPIEVQ